MDRQACTMVVNDEYRTVLMKHGNVLLIPVQEWTAPLVSRLCRHSAGRACAHVHTYRSSHGPRGCT